MSAEASLQALKKNVCYRVKELDFKKLFNENICILNDTQLEQFEKYFELLVSYNEKVNLTAITEREDVFLKHFYDSCLPLKSGIFKEGNTVIDVGCGGGFPSIPLKIAMPSLKFTMMDSTGKKTDFVKMVVKELGLSDVNVINARAEEAGQSSELREQFDISVARAVASLNVLMEYCVPFIKTGGSFVALKSRTLEEEVKEASNAAGMLGVRKKEIFTFTLPETDNIRNIIVYEKIKPTDKRFPRKTGKPSKNPL